MRICQDKRKELSCRHVHRSWKEITPKSPPLFVDVGIGTGSKRRKPPEILDRRSPALTRRNRLPQRTRTCVCRTVDISSHGRSSTAESEPEERGGRNFILSCVGCSGNTTCSRTDEFAADRRVRRALYWWPARPTTLPCHTLPGPSNERYGGEDLSRVCRVRPRLLGSDIQCVTAPHRVQGRRHGALSWKTGFLETLQHPQQALIDSSDHGQPQVTSMYLSLPLLLHACLTKGPNSTRSAATVLVWVFQTC